MKITKKDLKNLKKVCQNHPCWEDGDFVEIPHDENVIFIWFRRGKFFLEFNGKFIKMAKTLKPILNKLNQHVTTW